MGDELRLRVLPDGSLIAEPQAAINLAGGYPLRATGTPTGTSPMYGRGGLFGMCGVHPTLVNAMVGPMGVESILKWVPSDVENPLYDAITYIGSSGYAQSGLCSDCGTPTLKECVQTACFGRMCQMTGEHALDQLGMRMHEGQPRMALFGNITDPAGNVLLAQGQQLTDRFTLDLIAAAYNLRRYHGGVLWTGNPAANLGGYWEFPGIYLLINTGKTDVASGLACPALDSYIRNYGNNIIGAAGAPNIVREISSIVRSVRYRADGAGLNSDTMQTYIIMHPIHWDQVATAWACGYGLSCANYAVTMNNDALAIAKLRDQYLSSRQIPIDGKMYPVVLDNLIPLTAAPYGNQTAFCGSVTVLTTDIEGETVYWGEYQDLQKTISSVLAWFRSMFGNTPVAITDGGRFLIAPTVSGGICIDARILLKTRMIARMPQLSGRLTNVCAVPLGFYPDVTGSGGLYEKEGGASTKPYLGLYGDCGTLTESQ